MKKIFYLLFVFPLLFSCGGDSSSEEISKNSNAKILCDFIEIQKNLFTDILNGTPKEIIDKKYNLHRAEFIKIVEEMEKSKNDNEMKAIEEEFNNCRDNDEELYELGITLQEYAIKNQMKYIEGIFGKMMMY